MFRAPRSIPLVAMPLLVAVAVFGYLLGNHGNGTGSPAASDVRAGVLSVASALLEYPPSWQQVAAAPAVPGLSLEKQVALAPGGDPAQAGLIAGGPPGGEPSPLPQRLRSQLSRAPSTEVVNLPGGQAYGYSRLRLAGYDKTLELFVIPTQNDTSKAVVACYATASAAAGLRQCEQIVAKFSLLGQPQSDLTPDAGYAQSLVSALEPLERERLSLRRRLGDRPTPAVAGDLAVSLADRYSAAAKAVAAIEAPTVAGAATAALVSAARRASDAYRSFTAAVKAESNSRYVAALHSIEVSESGVEQALQSFALLGYSLS